MTVDEGDPRAPFSLTATPKCRERRHYIPWIAPLYPWSIPYNAVKEGGIKYCFWVFGMSWPGIEPQSSGLLANTIHEANE